LVDLYGRKNQWICAVQLILGLLSLALAASLYTTHFVLVSIVLFGLMALVSATQDVAIDGYYLEILDKQQQSFYVGVRSAVFKLAWLFGQGALVFIAGWLASQSQFGLGVKGGWAVAFGLSAVIFLAGGLTHLGLPFKARAMAASDRSEKSQNPEPKSSAKFDFSEFGRAFVSFFDQPGIIAIVLYACIFRLGDALMLKMAMPFLLDPVAKGGLALETQQVALIYGGVGVGFLLVGGLVGSFLVSKFGLKKMLMPTAIFQNSAILLYYLLSLNPPSVPLVAVCNAIEQFAYGLGVSAYMVFLMRTVNPRYPQFKAGHYAIVTAFMAAGNIIPGFFSGNLQTAVGYQNFFLISFLAAIPGMMIIRSLPLNDE
jgi:PAT family beta-lactamase induction signal transducer AmpG